jgi:hypothetical protein
MTEHPPVPFTFEPATVTQLSNFCLDYKVSAFPSLGPLFPLSFYIISYPASSATAFLWHIS